MKPMRTDLWTKELILAINIRNDVDLVASRIRSREVACACGFAVQEQVMISGIVTEITRSVFGHVSSCELQFFLKTSPGRANL